VFVPTIFSQAPSEVKIGSQIWTTKNLDVSTFRNGEAIPEAKNAEEWKKAGENKTAAFCNYDFDSEIGKVYGKLYNWYAVNDPRGLAPKGYHIPTDTEWTILIEALGGESIAFKNIKSKTGWQKNGVKSGNGNNSSGFSALPGGECNRNGYFSAISQNGGWWSSSEGSAGSAWYRVLYNVDTQVLRGNSFKKFGLSVRCIRD
jgi:uncharacterized protein (TIGR02145 family)